MTVSFRLTVLFVRTRLEDEEVVRLVEWWVIVVDSKTDCWSYGTLRFRLAGILSTSAVLFRAVKSVLNQNAFLRNLERAALSSKRNLTVEPNIDCNADFLACMGIERERPWTFPTPHTIPHYGVHTPFQLYWYSIISQRYNTWLALGQRRRNDGRVFDVVLSHKTLVQSSTHNNCRSPGGRDHHIGFGAGSWHSDQPLPVLYETFWNRCVPIDRGNDEEFLSFRSGRVLEVDIVTDVIRAVLSYTFRGVVCTVPTSVVLYVRIFIQDQRGLTVSITRHYTVE